MTRSHAPRPHDYGRAFAAGIALNVAFVAVEAVYGLRAGSLALLADAGHNAGDVLALGMAWGATLLARREPSPRFTYGLQSASILAALGNALLLMLAVGAIAWEAVLRLASPQATATGIMMAVAAVGIAVNGITAWMFHGGQHDLNLRGAFLHMTSDAVVSLGVVIAGVLIALTGRLWIDPAVSLLICVVVVAGTWRLLKDALPLALHAAPDYVATPEVRAFLESLDGVRGVHDLHVWATSTTDAALSAHLRMPGGHPGDAFILRVSDSLKERFHIAHATLQIELGEAPCEGCGQS